MRRSSVSGDRVKLPAEIALDPAERNVDLACGGDRSDVDDKGEVPLAIAIVDKPGQRP